MKYGLLSYKTVNLGDEIQTLAARRFPPRVDVLLDRDRPSSWHVEERTKVILNGWFKLHPEDWPVPESQIHPLFISFHISPSDEILTRMLSPIALEYYRRHEPIGCRDTHTVRLLSERGISAHFSGCLTLTLQSRNRLKTDEIVLSDVPREIAQLAPRDVRHRLVTVTHINREHNRFQAAAALLDLYSRARLVITSRLHCALPCLAFGTPVVFLRESFTDARFAGLLEFLPRMSTQDVLAKRARIPWSDGPDTAGDFGALQADLIARCSEFVAAGEPAL
jgi:hypothetical protein